jgi:hypothetical protein
MTQIDIRFNVFNDTPGGKDPDSYSPTLRKYHQKLWSKLLPNGKLFELDLDHPRLLHHNSELGEFFLSSDAIGHTYKGVKKMSHIVEQLPATELDKFFNLCATIGGFILFPSKRIDGKMTINGSRGVNHKIQDRFDLTLECIRRFYINQDSPLSETFERYTAFFELFENFQGYAKFFLLHDLVSDDFQKINFWHPFSSFANAPLPQELSEYHSYKSKVVQFISARNDRIFTISENIARTKLDSN